MFPAILLSLEISLFENQQIVLMDFKDLHLQSVSKRFMCVHTLTLCMLYAHKCMRCMRICLRNRNFQLISHAYHNMNFFANFYVGLYHEAQK